MIFSASLASIALCSLSLLATASPLEKRQFKHNDFSCRSEAHPNPVVLMHGLGATYYEDINEIDLYLQQQGFCTFSVTYGTIANFPLAGGFVHIAESAVELGNFINLVKTNTGASKIDLVGHSEGGFQALYVPKFTNVSSFIDNIVAIAPPTHGTALGNLVELPVTGNLTRELVELLCEACADVSSGGDAIVALNDGPIVQSGNKVTVVISKYDEVVVPARNAFVDEEGVRNLYVQDFCPFDVSGHIGEPYDPNILAIVLNTLNGSTDGPDVCSSGIPLS